MIRDIVVNVGGLSIIYLFYDLVKRSMKDHSASCTAGFGFALVFTCIIYIILLWFMYV